MDEQTYEYLNRQQGAWNANRDVPTDGHQEVPDGTYQTKIVSVVIRNSKKSGEPYLSWRLEVVGGIYNGWTVFRNNQLRTDQNIKFLAKDLAKVGLELPESILDLPEAVVELEGRLIEIKIETGSYRNVYIQSLVRPDVPAPTYAKVPPASISDDDVPF